MDPTSMMGGGGGGGGDKMQSAASTATGTSGNNFGPTDAGGGFSPILAIVVAGFFCLAILGIVLASVASRKKD